MPSVTLTTDTTNTAKLQAVVEWIVRMVIDAYIQQNAERLTATVRAGFSDQVAVT